MRPANGAKIHSTSPNRYSPCSWALRPAPIFFWLGVMSKTPAPVPMLGGSAGDPSVAKEPNGICAATGGAVAMPNARSEAAPSHVMNLFLTVFPPPPIPARSEIALIYPKTQTVFRKQNQSASSNPLHSFRRQDQLLANAGLHRRMPGIGNDQVSRFGPGASQLVGAANRADHVVAALHDDGGQMPDLSDARDQITFAAEQMAAEKMRFDSRQAQSEPVFGERGHRLGIWQQRRAGALVDAPGARRRHVDARVRVSQTPVIGRENVAAFALGEEPRKGAPSLGKHSANAVRKPLDLLAPAQKDAAQHEPDAAQRVRLGVMQRQCRAPGPAKYQPFVDAERGAKMFDIGHEMGWRVVGDLAQRRRSAGAALIKNHDPPIFGIEKPPMHRRRACAGTAVQKQRRDTARITGLLPIHRMAR